MFKVFKQSIAHRMIAEGCRLIEKEPNFKKRGFYVYIFEDNQFNKEMFLKSQERNR